MTISTLALLAGLAAADAAPAADSLAAPPVTRPRPVAVAPT